MDTDTGQPTTAQRQREMNSRGWEHVDELPSRKLSGGGYREAGSPDPIVATEHWRAPIGRLRLWFRSGPERPWEHTARACVLTERHLYVTRMTGKSARVPLDTITECREHLDGAIAIAVRDGADVLLPPLGRALADGLAACRDKHEVPLQPFTGPKRKTPSAKAIASVTFALLFVTGLTVKVVRQRAEVRAKVAACAESSECAEKGACDRKTKAFGLRTKGTCRPTQDEHCAQSQACTTDGSCTLARNLSRCAPATPEHCTQSTQCTRQGRCSLQKPKNSYSVSTCVQSDASCRLGQPCAEEGLCSPSSYGKHCRARFDADCKTSRACTKHDRCRARRGKCVTSCRALSVCKKTGVCVDGEPNAAGEITCEAKRDEDCEKSNRCATHGRCAVDTNPKTRYRGCAPKTDDHCAQSKECTKYGRCLMGPEKQYGPRSCVQPEGYCRKRPACASKGLCSRGTSSQACQATLDKDCEQSKACTEDGQCLARSGVCMNSCAESKSCKARGSCDDGKPSKASGLIRCTATQDADCQASKYCKLAGKCRLVTKYGVGSCQALTDADCAGSGWCKTMGWCARGQYGSCEKSTAPTK